MGGAVMRQHLLSVYHSEGQPQPEGAEIERIYKQVDTLNAELMSEGAWFFGCGLYGPDTATVVRVQDGETLTTDGPFAETKEQVGGFWILKAPDLDAALALAARGSAACGAPIEVRPFQDEPSD